MRFAPISSVADIALSDMSTFKMCLAQLALKHESYHDFFRDAAAKGDFVLLDNGENEGEQVTNEDLCKLIESIKPSEVVAPDSFRRPEVTVLKSAEFIRELRERYSKGSGPAVMGVVQGTSISSLQSCALELLNVGCNTLGLGFNNYADLASNHLTGSVTGLDRMDQLVCVAGRVTARAMLRTVVAPGVPIHLLGLYTPYELTLYRSDAQVRSCDSSMPILLASCGITLGSDLRIQNKPKSVLPFEEPLPEEARVLARTNYETMKQSLNLE